MKKSNSYKGGGRILGEPTKPVKSTIDKTKYSDKLSKENTDDYVADSLDALSPAVLEAGGYKYHSGTMGGKDITYEKDGNLYLFNETPAFQNRYRLTNIGNPNATPTVTTTPTVTQSPLLSTSKPAPAVDPNRKPLNLSNPNLTYDPNTGQYSSPITGKTIQPIVEQYKHGGKVKGYAYGGDVDPLIPEQTNSTSLQPSASTNATNDYASNITSAQQKNRAKRNNQKLGAFTQAAGGAAMGIGEQMYTAPQDVITSDKQKQQNEAVDTTIDTTAASMTPWYGLAKGISNIGRSQLKKDQYGNVVGGVNQAADEWMKPTNESVRDAYQREGLGGAAKDFFLGGQSQRAVSNLTGHGEDTTGFWGKLNKFSGNTAIKKKAADNIALLNQGKLDADAAEVQAERERLWLARQGKMNSALVKRNDMVTGYADGGLVRGKGTGKSDSINAKVEPNSFIVPAENAGIAIELKSKLLQKPTAKANLNQRGGKNIKISNGEVVLSPEERMALEMKGVDVDSLAPNSEVDEQITFKKGGPVNPSEERAKIKAEQDALRKERADKSNQGKARDINKDTVKRQNDASRELIRSDAYLKSLEKEYEDYNKRLQSGKRLIGETDERIRANKKAMLDKIDQANQVRETANKEYRQVTGKSSTASSSNGPGLDYMGSNRQKPNTDTSVRDLTTMLEDPSTDPVVMNKKVRTTAKPKSVLVQETPFSQDWANTNTGPEDVPEAQSALVTRPKSKYDTGELVNGIDPNQAAYDRDVQEAMNRNNPSGERKDYSGMFSSAINYGLPLAQTLIGLRALKKAGARPVDQIDNDYLQAIGTQQGLVTQANDQARFGLTGAEKTALDMQNAELTNAARFGARNYSGGSSSNALNMERAAANDAYGRGLQSKILDNQLKRQKQEQAYGRQQDLTNMLSHKQELNRRLFGDTMNAFQQNQAAGSQLLGAGIQNAIGANRYENERKQIEQRQALENSWLNNLGK